MDDKKIIIEWVDSKGVTSVWEDRDDLESMGVCLCKTIGFVTELTDEYVTVAQSVSDDQVLGRISIPMVSIMSKIEI